MGTDLAHTVKAKGWSKVRLGWVWEDWGSDSGCFHYLNHWFS